MNDMRLIERWCAIREVGDGSPESTDIPPTFVIPAKAGIQKALPSMGGRDARVPGHLDSRFRGNDGNLARIWTARPRVDAGETRASAEHAGPEKSRAGRYLATSRQA